LSAKGARTADEEDGVEEAIRPREPDGTDPPALPPVRNKVGMVPKEVVEEGEVLEDEDEEGEVLEDEDEEGEVLEDEDEEGEVLEDEEEEGEVLEDEDEEDADLGISSASSNDNLMPLRIISK
jgi:hypothetical protein